MPLGTAQQRADPLRTLPHQFGLVAGLSRAIMRSASGKPSKGDEDHSLPLLVFFHGGGLLAGSREPDAWFPHWLLSASPRSSPHRPTFLADSV